MASTCDSQLITEFFKILVESDRQSRGVGYGPLKLQALSRPPLAHECSVSFEVLFVADVQEESFSNSSGPLPHLRCRPKGEFPGLGRKILPEAVMLFFAHEVEPCLFVDVSRSMKSALRPKGDPLIPHLPCEADAFLN